MTSRAPAAPRRRPVRLARRSALPALAVLLAAAVLGAPAQGQALRQVGVEVTLKQLDTAAWFPALARRDYVIGANLTAPGIDDPDVYLYENYKCGTSRNYTEHCNAQVDRLIDQQSQELDRDKRLRLVWDIQRRLEADVARPMLGWRKEYFTQWPHVRNLVPHHSLSNGGRMQEVWLDR